MSNILIATLGESPIVVTAATKALRELESIAIDIVEILYPSIESERLIGLGYDMIEEHLRDKCEVRPQPLNFADTNTRETSFEFLQTLNGLLETHERNRDDVYLLLAGGRKNMSVLLAVITQFYPCVKGLYHILDKHEDDPAKRNFHSIESLVENEPQRAQWLEPAIENLILVRLPYQPIANAIELRKWLSKQTQSQDAPISITVEAESFFGRIFQQIRSGSASLTVHLTRTAYEQYCDWADRGDNRRERIDAYLKSMGDLNWLKHARHDKFSSNQLVFHFCKVSKTAERPFFYTLPLTLDTPSPKAVEQVIVCGFSVHTNETDYDVSGEDWMRRGDFAPVKKLPDLPKRPITLIAPLGQSPMVVTQACVLLQERENLAIERIVVLYPQKNARIRNAVNILKEVCKRRNLTFEPKPIEQLGDVRSEEDGNIYIQSLQNVIIDERKQFSGRSIVLLLSGGRKGMSVLSLYAAQVAGLERVYHTIILDPKLEARIEIECAIGAIKSLSTAEQIRRLFLDIYDHAQFDLVSIPVIKLQQSS